MSLRGYTSTYYLLCAIAFLMMLATQITNPLMSIFAKRIGASGVMIGYAISAYWVSRVVLEVPSGFISARYGYYKPLVAGALLTVVGNIMTVNVDSPVYLIVVRAIMGLGAPLFFAISMTFIVSLFGAEMRGRAMGLFQGIEFIGTIIGSGMSGYVIESLGFRGGFILSSALAVAATAILVIPPHIRVETQRHSARIAMNLSDMPEVLTNPTLILMAVITLAEFVMSTGLIYTVFPLYAEETLGFPLAEIGYVMGARSVGFVVAMFTMGIISDRVGRKPVLIFGIASTGTLIFMMNFIKGYYGLAALICLMGFTSGAIWIMGPVLAAEAVKPHQRGAGIGVYRTFFDLGSVFGPIIMTAVLTMYGVSYCFYVSAGLLILSVPLAWMIKENRDLDPRNE